jgi:hypothetical protein
MAVRFNFERKNGLQIGSIKAEIRNHGGRQEAPSIAFNQ